MNKEKDMHKTGLTHTHLPLFLKKAQEEKEIATKDSTISRLQDTESVSGLRLINLDIIWDNISFKKSMLKAEFKSN